MHVLQINTLDKKGGAAKVAYSLKEELEKRGHKTSMFVGRKYSDEKNIKLLNDVRSFSGKVRRKLAYWLANDIDLFSSNHIFKTPEFKKADIIHCHNLHGNYFNLGALKKISKLKPVIWTFHDMWPITAHCGYAMEGDLKNGFFQCPSLDAYQPIAWHNEKYLEFRKRKIYGQSNFHITTPSRWLMEKTKASVLKNNPISLIYNGIDTSIFKPLLPKEARQTLNLPQDKKIILFAAKGGGDRERKGIEYVYAAMERFKHDKNILWITVGGSKIDNINPQYLSIPYLSDQKILAQYYAASDIFLFPSLADNCPLVVLEAMACGLPIVAFETGGIPELVGHKVNGYIAGYKNIDDLKVGIEYLLNLSSQEIEKMRKYSINKITAGFTVEKMVDQYLELYRKLLYKN